MIALLDLAILLTGSAVVQADKVVREQYGNLVETWRHRGKETEVRDRYGNTIGTEKIDR